MPVFIPQAVVVGHRWLNPKFKPTALLYNTSLYSMLYIKCWSGIFNWHSDNWQGKPNNISGNKKLIFPLAALWLGWYWAGEEKSRGKCWWGNVFYVASLSMHQHFSWHTPVSQSPPHAPLHMPMLLWTYTFAEIHPARWMLPSSHKKVTQVRMATWGKHANFYILHEHSLFRCPLMNLMSPAGQHGRWQHQHSSAAQTSICLCFC